MPSRAYLLSLPERVIRSALGFSAGLLREIGELALPRTVRRGQLYKSLVDTTLRYVIEQVGGAKGVYPTEVPQAQDFLARRGVGHAIELLGIAAFRISPVWVFAALADLSGLGRRLIPEIAEALKEEGLLEKEAQFENVGQLLDSLRKPHHAWPRRSMRRPLMSPAFARSGRKFDRRRVDSSRPTFRLSRSSAADGRNLRTRRRDRDARYSRPHP